MSDKIKNYYELLPSNLKKEHKPDKHFKKHFIRPCSMIACIGSTGAGKSNALIDFLTRKNEAFYDIIVFSGSTTEEPLLQLLKEKMPEIQMFNDINEVPELSSFEDEKENEKLIIWDDFINLKPKEMKKINEYLTSSRKYGFTNFIMCQNYTSMPKLILRNLQYIIMFRLNDNISINNIIRNHNIHNVQKDKFKEFYIQSTSEPRQFFLIDLRGDKDKHLRSNFTNFLKLE
jgi:hypothetical protein